MAASAFTTLWRMYSPKALQRVQELLSRRATAALPPGRANPIRIVPMARAKEYALSTERGQVVGHVGVQVRGDRMRIERGGHLFDRTGLPVGAMRDIGRQLAGVWQPQVRKLQLLDVGKKWPTIRVGAGRTAPAWGGKPMVHKGTQQIMTGGTRDAVMMTKIPGFGKSTGKLRIPTGPEMASGRWTLKTGEVRPVRYSKRFTRQDFRLISWNLFDYAKKGGFVGTRRHARLAGRVATDIAKANPNAVRKRIFEAMMTGMDRPTLGVRHTGGRTGRKFNPFDFLP